MTHRELNVYIKTNQATLDQYHSDTCITNRSTLTNCFVPTYNKRGYHGLRLYKYQATRYVKCEIHVSVHISRFQDPSRYRYYLVLPPSRSHPLEVIILLLSSSCIHSYVL